MSFFLLNSVGCNYAIICIFGWLLSFWINAGVNCWFFWMVADPWNESASGCLRYCIFAFAENGYDLVWWICVGILHTIIFHRALGLVRPKEIDLELFEITYVSGLDDNCFGMSIIMHSFHAYIQLWPFITAYYCRNLYGRFLWACYEVPDSFCTLVQSWIMIFRMCDTFVMGAFLKNQNNRSEKLLSILRCIVSTERCHPPFFFLHFWDLMFCVHTVSWLVKHEAKFKVNVFLNFN